MILQRARHDLRGRRRTAVDQNDDRLAADEIARMCAEALCLLRIAAACRPNARTSTSGQQVRAFRSASVLPSPSRASCTSRASTVSLTPPTGVLIGIRLDRGKVSESAKCLYLENRDLPKKTDMRFCFFQNYWRKGRKRAGKGLRVTDSALATHWYGDGNGEGRD